MIVIIILFLLIILELELICLPLFILYRSYGPPSSSSISSPRISSAQSWLLSPLNSSNLRCQIFLLFLNSPNFLPNFFVILGVQFAEVNGCAGVFESALCLSFFLVFLHGIKTVVVQLIVSIRLHIINIDWLYLITKYEFKIT